MTDARFSDVVEAAAKVIDAVGVLVIVAGLLVAIALAARRRLDRSVRTDGLKGFRQDVGQAILLGLEFLVAADIVRTVAVDPSFASVGVLAVIVAVRTFLSFTLDVELDGRWPWQTRRAAAGGRVPPR